MKQILITGGAGFAGSSIALDLKRRFVDCSVVAFDNLKRRGSELNIPRLRAGGVEFLHGDIRCSEDFPAGDSWDLVVECAAEPSALAGLDGNPQYVINTNLSGTVNCLEFARKRGAAFVFLSTSRVYPINPLNELKFTETETRFSLACNQSIAGASEHGIAENFPLDGARTLYGSTKLSSELLIHEYVETFKLPAIINRCGVLTGPWQMGKVDQGVIVLWLARHFWKKPLSYIGFDGSGKQVRDILHIDDLCDLLAIQIPRLKDLSSTPLNVGGGNEVSVSLREMTELSRRATGNTVSISASKETRPGDVRIYVTDYRKVMKDLSWKPRRSVETIVEDITKWISEHRLALEPILT